MSFNNDQAREPNGRWAGGSHAGEADARQAGKFPVAPHATNRSVASHTGMDVTRLNERTGRFEFVATNKRRAVAESIARGQRFDKQFARVR